MAAKKEQDSSIGIPAASQSPDFRVPQNLLNVFDQARGYSLAIRNRAFRIGGSILALGGFGAMLPSVAHADSSNPGITVEAGLLNQAAGTIDPSPNQTCYSNPQKVLRISNIVGPAGTQVMLARKDSLMDCNGNSADNVDDFSSGMTWLPLYPGSDPTKFYNNGVNPLVFDSTGHATLIIPVLGAGVYEKLCFAGAGQGNSPSSCAPEFTLDAGGNITDLKPAAPIVPTSTPIVTTNNPSSPQVSAQPAPTSSPDVVSTPVPNVNTRPATSPTTAASASASPSKTSPTPEATPSPDPTPSPDATVTPVASATSKPVVVPTTFTSATAIATVDSSPTKVDNKATSTPAATATPAPTNTLAATATSIPSATSTPVPTFTATLAPTVKPTETVAPVTQTPTFRVLALYFDRTTFNSPDGTIHLDTTMTDQEKQTTVAMYNQFLGHDFSAYASNYVKISYDLVDAGPLKELDQTDGGYYPSALALQRQNALRPGYDATMAVWKENGIDTKTGQPIKIQNHAGLTDVAPAVSTVIIDSVMQAGDDGLAHEMGHTIQGKAGSNIDMDNPPGYNNCDTGQSYSLNEADVYKKAEGGWIFDAYSGKVAIKGTNVCIGPNQQTWAKIGH